MNNLIQSHYRFRRLLNEIHNWTITRTIQTSSHLRTTKTDEDVAEETKSNAQKTRLSSKSSLVSTSKNLFSALAGLKAVSNYNVNEAVEMEEQVTPSRKTIDRQTSEFKTSKALKSAIEKSAKIVSESFPDKEKTESDLMQQLHRYEDAKAAGQRGDVESISSLLSGMKVLKAEEKLDEKEMQLKIRTLEMRRVDIKQSTIKGGEQWPKPDNQGQEREWKSQMDGVLLARSNKQLGIFSPQEEIKPVAESKSATETIWDIAEADELNEVLHANIRHGFDEMLQWSAEGKLWKYPIDNEQGLEEEATVGFHEHVLLDDLIEDFPKTGPIREFIELVVIGLSKNPYFTIKQKKEHIDWFRQYFKDKENVLRDADSIPKDFSFA